MKKTQTRILGRPAGLLVVIVAIFGTTSPAWAEDSFDKDYLALGFGRVPICWILNSFEPLETLICEDFVLPHDCVRFRESMALFGSNTASGMSSLRQIELGRYVCRRALVVGSADPGSQHDYVSSTNFKELGLELVPHDVLLTSYVDSFEMFGNKESAVRQARALCGRKAPCPALSWAGIAATEERWVPVERVDPETCHFVDGTFAGTVSVENGTVRCKHEPDGLGVGLSDVRFRDVNHDGAMDAIINVIEVGDGGSAPSATDLFVLTRRTPDGPLEPVEVTEE